MHVSLISVTIKFFIILTLSCIHVEDVLPSSLLHLVLTVTISTFFLFYTWILFTL